MVDSPDDYIMHEFKLCLHSEVDDAMLVSQTGNNKDAVWLPKLLIDIVARPIGDDETITLLIPAYLAMEKELSQ
jgi:hypothetical protein